MSNYQQQYKKKPVGFRDSDTGRLVRAVKHEERRKVHRAENFDRHRVLPQIQEYKEARPKVSDLATRLARWKAERDIMKKVESQKKRPAFRVGVVHHKFYSPPVSSKVKVAAVPCHARGTYKVKNNPTPEKRITRATQKRLEAKKAGTSVTPAKASASRSKADFTKNSRKRLPSSTKTERYSFAPENYEFKAPAGLEGIPLFGRFAIPNLANMEDKPWPTTSNFVRRSKKITSTPEKDRCSVVSENESFKAPASPEERPVFGRFVISNEAKVNQPLCEKEIQRESIDEEEKPFANFSPIDKTQKTRKSGSSEARSQSNSSIESVILKISSEDDSVEEHDLLKKPDEEELDFPQVEEAKIVADIANDIRNEISTPPRSGTPVPASFSPYIVSSRGKESARKEQKIKMGIRRSSANDVPTKDTVMKNLNISVDEEERTAQYFKFILDREIERLKEICDKWETIMKEPDLSEDSHYQINQAIGQTNLLIRKKFERFRRLVLDCETGKGEMLVQCRDLQGFWDLIYMEVKDCESRFLKLDFLRSKGWIEDQIAVVTKKVTRKKVAPAKPKINAKSSARSWILAARKKKLQGEDPNVDKMEVTETSENEALVNLKDQKSRPSMETSLDKKRITPKNTPTTLLKKVQLSEASRRVISPLVAMKLSRMCKTPEVKLDDSISYVNSDQTPSKGILKKTEDSSGKKSKGKVDFDYVYLEGSSFTEEVDDPLQNSIDLGRALAQIDAYDEDDCKDEVFTEEQSDVDDVKEILQNSLDIGRALARIDTYHEDECFEVPSDNMKNVTIRGAEKRLDFEDVSFEESPENADSTDSTEVIAEMPHPPVPLIHIIPDTPSTSKLAASKDQANRRSSRRASKVFEASVGVPKQEETSVSCKVLRNRSIIIETPSKDNRRSIKSTAREKQNISADISIKENSDPLRGLREANSEERDVATEMSACEDVLKPRRTTRRSVRFNADCMACTPKATLPKTPHTRRRRKVSLLGDSFQGPSTESDIAPKSGDLMSFDTP